MQTRFEAFAFIGKSASVREPVDQGLDSMSAYWGLGPVCPRAVGAQTGLSPRVRKNLTQVDLLGYADHPSRRSDASPLRPAGRALAPARQHKYDHIHDEHGDESQQNHD